MGKTCDRQKTPRKMEEHALTQRITKEIMYELIDEVTLSLCFEVHRSAKLGTIFLSETDPESERNHQIVDTVGKDVFGQVKVNFGAKVAVFCYLV